MTKYIFTLCIFFLVLENTILGQSVNRNIESGYISTQDSLRMYYRIQGTAKDTVLLPLDSWLFEPFKRLTEKYTLITYDPINRGRSESSKDISRMTIEKIVNDLECIRKYFNLKKINLIGWSYLGAVAAHYANVFPEKVSNLVLVCPISARMDPYMIDASMNLEKKIHKLLSQDDISKKYGEVSKPGNCKNQFELIIAAQLYDTTKLDSILNTDFCQFENEMMENNGISNLFENLKMYDWSESFSNHNTRTLIIHSENDNFNIKSSLEWNKLLRNSIFQVVKYSGHYPFWENPKDFFRILENFLDR